MSTITAPAEPVAFGDQPVTAEVTFSDPGVAYTRDIAWDWGDATSNSWYGATSPSWVSHSYAEPGVYAVQVTVTDDDGGSDTVLHEFIVIYDADGGFVTCGGWVDSPAGAYYPDPELAGKANFGLISKYAKGAAPQAAQAALGK